MVDIWVISKNEPIDWPTIFRDTGSKAVGIFPPDIARRLAEFPLELLDVIKWTPDQAPSPTQFSTDINKITQQILG